MTAPHSHSHSRKEGAASFLWGSSTASYQVEGGIDNCDWAQAAREGRVPLCGRACDHYRLYEQDFDLAKELGHTGHRFSVEWARIEPREGEFDETELEHYRGVLRALHARGLIPFVTLWHFTLPVWFVERGGWERRDAPALFARYCAKAVEAFGDLATCYATMNEPMVYANNGWIRGIWPPFSKFSLLEHVRGVPAVLEKGEHTARRTLTPYRYFRVRRALARAHCAAYAAIKEVRPDTDVSIVMNIIVFDATRAPWYRVLAWLMNRHWTHSFVRQVQSSVDSIGVNYYIYKCFGGAPASVKNDMGWEVWPDQIDKALLMLARYGKPMMVTEAGVSDAHDTLRESYIRKTIEGIERAQAQGADVRGFFYWSLLDNYEWAAGFGQRFGLIEINYETLARTIRPSAWAYKRMIEERTKGVNGTG